MKVIKMLIKLSKKKKSFNINDLNLKTQLTFFKSQQWEMEVKMHPLLDIESSF